MSLDLLGEVIGHPHGGGHHHHHHGGHGGWARPGPWGAYPVPYYDWLDFVPTQGIDVDQLERAEEDEKALIEKVADEVAKKVAAKQAPVPFVPAPATPPKVAGLDLLGVMVGGYDVSAEQKQMNAIGPKVPVCIARALLKGGEKAIRDALAQGKGKWYEGALPGNLSRENVAGKLSWHAAELAKASDQTAIYGPGEDLKKWVMTAYIALNAVEEGRAYEKTNTLGRAASESWGQMWIDIKVATAWLVEQAKKGLQAAADALNELPNAFVKTMTGLPLWAWSLIILAAVGGVGFVGYKVLTGPAGAAVVSRYLPGGR